MWDSLIQILRNMINDNTSPYTYSDERLKSMLVTAGQILLVETSFDYTYIITITTPDISPNPFSNNDYAFIGLITLKAANLIIGGEYKIATKNSIVVNDAWSSINLSGQASSYKVMLDTFVKQYNEILMQHKFGNAKNIHAILTPYTAYDQRITEPFY